MTHQEKTTYAALFSGVIIFGLYFWRINSLLDQGRFDAPDAMALLGQTMLLLVVGGIAVNIVAMILMSILFAIVTNDAKPSFVVDERDRLIELHALRWSYYIFGAGFIGAMIVLAMGYGAFVVFNLIVASMMMATFLEGIIKLCLHRRGF